MQAVFDYLYFCIVDKTIKGNPDQVGISEELSQCMLSSLLPKFLQFGVTKDILWHLDDEDLTNIDLTKMEKKRYFIAKKKYGTTGK